MAPVKTLCSLLFAQAERFDHAVLYRHIGDDLSAAHPSLTYAGLCERAMDIGHWLHTRGAEDKAVLLVFSPGLAFVEALFGCFCAGAIAVPVSPPDPRRLDQGMERLRAVASASGSTLVLTDDLVGNAMDGLSESYAWIAQVERMAVAEIGLDLGRTWTPVDVQPEQVALVQYTSGSTGTPKGVMITHANVLDNQRQIRDGFGHDPEMIRARDGDFGVTWLPLFHDMGLIGHVLQPLFIGATSNFMSPLTFLRNPMSWLEAIAHFRAHTSGAPNFGYGLCVRKASLDRISDLDLGSWRVAYCGAEPVHHKTLQSFARHCAEAGFRAEALYPTYGLAEATLFVTGGRSCSGIRKMCVDATALSDARVVEVQDFQGHGRILVGCGATREGTDIFVVDPVTQVFCSAGDIGEVWVRGGSVAAGYWRDPDATESTFLAHTVCGKGPFLRTGDLGFVRDGQLYVTGRRKDLIILGGTNVYPQDVEACVEASHSALRPGCCAAFSIPVDEHEALVVCQEVRPGEEDFHAVALAIRRRLVRHEGLRPHALVLLDVHSLPKTSSGKVRRQACRQAFLGDELAERHRDTLERSARGGQLISWEELRVLPVETWRSVLTESLQEMLSSRLALPSADLPIDVAFESLAVDSLAVSELASQVERQLGITVDLFWLHPRATLQEVARDLYNKVRWG
jgi:acyl-CoA synthetase (AMP-forming)/AMP-acid ligase II